jgi:hypothetical protein
MVLAAARGTNHPQPTKANTVQTSGIFLSLATISTLSAATQEELQNYLFPAASAASDAPIALPAGPAAAAVEDDGPPDLSVAQARKLLAGCSERPAAALRFIAEQPQTHFPYRALLEAIGTDSSGTIRGTLAAITRRTRTVLGDSDAELIWYEGEKDHWTASVSEMTRTSLRKALGIA